MELLVPPYLSALLICLHILPFCSTSVVAKYEAPGWRAVQRLEQVMKVTNQEPAAWFEKVPKGCAKDK